MQHLFRFSSLLLVFFVMAAPALAAQTAPPVLIAQVGGLLRIGDSGDAVTLLQTRLANLGFYQGAIDGEFGAQTEAAVIQFQQSQNLTPDGIVGAQTTAALDRLSSSGSIGETPGIPFPPPIVEPPVASVGTTTPQGDRFSILELQRRLQARGFYQGPLDGLLGAQTRAAIRAAQRAYGLDANDVVNGRF